VATALTLTGRDGDGDLLNFVVVGLPQHGTLTGTGATLLYTPALNFNGTDSFTYKANDGLLDSNLATVTLTIAPVNDAPVADAQTVTTDEDVARALTLTGSDVDGDLLNFVVVGLPQHGTLTGTGATLLYTPALNFNGTDSFTYKANDGLLDSNLATVTLTIAPVNDAPVADAQTVTTDEAVATALTLTGRDGDGDLLNFVVVGLPQHGTLTGTGATLLYTPALNFNGTDSFTFKTNDGLLDSTVATVTLTITPVNDAPLANAQTVTTDEEVATALTLTGSDVDGDLLNFVVVGLPQHGTLTGTGANLLYTPALNFNGTDSFTFMANDGLLDSDVATVNLTINSINDAPVFTSNPPSSFVLDGASVTPGGDAILKVPGVVGTNFQVTFTWVSRSAAFNNEFGMYKVSDAFGRVGGLLPEDSGYAKAALQNAIVLFTSGQGAGATKQVTLEGGALYGFYIIQNAGKTKWLADNSNNSLTRAPLVFFSLSTANPDRFDHLGGTLQNSTLNLAWEDGTNGGDKDFNDALLRAVFSSAPQFVLPVFASVPLQGFIPGVSGDSIFQVPATLTGPLKALFKFDSKSASFNSEYGLYKVSDASGRIGSLRPGDSGYAKAALQSAIVIFSNSQGAGAQKEIVLEAGAYYGFSIIQNGTTAHFLSNNSSNSLTRNPKAFFSVVAANPDRFDHLRGSVVNGKLRFEWEDSTNGGDRDYNDGVISLELLAPAPAASQFTYQARTTDADGDAVGYSLVQAPIGASIDPQSGLLNWNATLGLNNFTIRASDGHGGLTDQSFTLNVMQAGQALMAEGESLASHSLVADLNTLNFQPLIDEAIARLSLCGVNAAALTALHHVTIQVADLPGGMLGFTGNDVITIDANAAGYGWFIDVTPQDDAEFHFVRGLDEWIADANSRAFSRMDLLTTVMHELGHALGLEHESWLTVMQDSLETGIRRWVGENSFSVEGGVVAAAVRSPLLNGLGAASRTPQAIAKPHQAVAASADFSRILGRVGTESLIDWTDNVPGNGHTVDSSLTPKNKLSWVRRFLSDLGTGDDQYDAENELEVTLPGPRT